VNRAYEILGPCMLSSHILFLSLTPEILMKRIKLPVLALSKQQKFANIVQKVEKLKDKQRESEKQLSNLFNSLMQKAFRGEL